MFPIEERYADLISIVVIVFLFSAVMPTLYIIGFISIAFMILSDKVLLFRVFQKPINYTADLQKKVSKTLYVVMIIHCVISPLLLSSSELMRANTAP